jgi:hypothetical protein
MVTGVGLVGGFGGFPTTNAENPQHQLQNTHNTMMNNVTNDKNYYMLTSEM